MANLDIIRGRSTVLSLANNSGATRSPGDLVILDTAASDAFTTSTSSNTTVPVGVVDETIGISSNGRVVFSGYARNVRTLGASVKGDYLYHSTTSVTAATMAGSNPQPGAFGRVTTAGSGTATTAYIFPTTETATASFSYASNSNDVGNPGVSGSSTLVSRADHVHRGVASISHTSNTFYGPITLVAQGSVGITSSATGTFAINAIGGSGGGAAFNPGSTLQRLSRTAGNLAMAATTTTMTELSSALRLTIAAATGDVLQIGFSAMAAAGTGEYSIDSATIVSGAIVNQVSAGSRGIGHGTGVTTQTLVGATLTYVVQAGDLSGGSVTVSPTFTNSGNAGTVYATTTYGLTYWVLNLKQ